MRDVNRRRAEFDKIAVDRRRQFRRFRNGVIALQVLAVVCFVWLLTHPEAIGSWLRRLANAADA